MAAVKQPKRPKRVRAGVFNFEMRLDGELSQKADVLGTCLTDSLVILLDGNMPDEMEAETALHESLHGIWFQIFSKQFSNEDEERIIATLSPALFSLIRENPEFITWIQSAGR